MNFERKQQKMFVSFEVIQLADTFLLSTTPKPIKNSKFAGLSLAQYVRHKTSKGTFLPTDSLAAFGAECFFEGPKKAEHEGTTSQVFATPVATSKGEK